MPGSIPGSGLNLTTEEEMKNTSKIINQLPVLEIPETNPDTVKIAIDCGHNVKSVDSIVYPDGSEGQLNFNIYLI